MESIDHRGKELKSFRQESDRREIQVYMHQVKRLISTAQEGRNPATTFGEPASRGPWEPGRGSHGLTNITQQMEYVSDKKYVFFSKFRYSPLAPIVNIQTCYRVVTMRAKNRGRWTAPSCEKGWEDRGESIRGQDDVTKRRC